MEDSIVAVVVTYNRLTLLKKCILALRKQTKKINDIVVIINGSDDGTKEWLENQKGLIIFYQTNTGGSGGFNRGIKEAYKKGFDWIWIMDDDAFPDEHCLEKMFSCHNLIYNKNFILTPVVVENNEIDFLHRGYISINKFQIPLQTPINDKKLLKESIHEITFASYIGMCIGREIVKVVGYPNEDFFIFHDDVEYSIRIQNNGFKIYLIKEAVIFHKVEPISIQPDVYINELIGMRKNTEGKLTNKRVNTSRNDTITMKDVFLCMAKRNIINIALVHYKINIRISLYILKDIIRTILVIAKRSDRKKLIQLYISSFKQAFTGKFSNNKLIEIYKKV
ncbi:glycosyltransferase [Spirosoma radiotolerans]|uniref:glycosyltransferase n=1 Tax=Spirosoma radiotolerans TaxID=1379870 RepID=UPI0006978981|nr:glycosyltransferase [Spirosoma radiotolerans]